MLFGIKNIPKFHLIDQKKDGGTGSTMTPVFPVYRPGDYFRSQFPKKTLRYYPDQSYYNIIY